MITIAKVFLFSFKETEPRGVGVKALLSSELWSSYVRQGIVEL